MVVAMTAAAADPAPVPAPIATPTPTPVPAPTATHPETAHHHPGRPEVPQHTGGPSVVDPYPATTEPAATTHDDSPEPRHDDSAEPKHHDPRTKPNPYD
jgi:hypothetical protein